MKIDKFPLNPDRTPMDLLDAVLVDASGNGGARVADSVFGPDGMRIDTVGLVLRKSDGSIFDLTDYIEYDDQIFAKKLGVVPGATNSAGLVQAVYNTAALTGRVAPLTFGLGQFTFDGGLVLDKKPVQLRGLGCGSHSDGNDGATQLFFPPDYTGINFSLGAALAPGGQRSKIRDMTISPTGYGLTSECTVNFTAGNNYCDYVSGTNDWQVGMVMCIYNAGPSQLMIGKSVTMTAGSNVASVASILGNPGVFGYSIGAAGTTVGRQKVTIAGAGAGGADLIGYVGTWDSTSFTVVDAAGGAKNCQTPVAGAAYTVVWPLIAKIKTIVGNRITFDQTPSNVQSVAGERARHAGTGIWCSTTIAADQIQLPSDWMVAMALVGESGSGNADAGNFVSSEFLGNFIGVYFRGYDAQINNFYMPTFGHAQIQVLDCSLIQNKMFGPHFAFNIGYAAPLNSGTAGLVLPYVEGGTSMPGSDSQWSFGGEGMINGSGWNHTGPTSDPSQGDHPPISTPKLKVLGNRGGSSGGSDLTGPFKSVSTTYSFSIRANINAYPAGIAGMNMTFGDDTVRLYMQAYDHTANAYVPMRLYSSGLETNTDIKIPTAKGLYVNALKVVGDRQTGLPVAATDAATTQALVNAIRTALITHGLIS